MSVVVADYLKEDLARTLAALTSDAVLMAWRGGGNVP